VPIKLNAAPSPDPHRDFLTGSGSAKIKCAFHIPFIGVASGMLSVSLYLNLKYAKYEIPLKDPVHLFESVYRTYEEIAQDNL
jgi:hypothetical protein